MARLMWLEFGLLDSSKWVAGVSHPSFDTVAFSPDPAFCSAHCSSFHFDRTLSPSDPLFRKITRLLKPACRAFFPTGTLLFDTDKPFCAGDSLLFGHHQPFSAADTLCCGADTLLNRTKYAV